ncbi:MAG TPA: DUF885 domain-containing protein [Actinoplanes sp.]|nr:DUF885 domain-containing protein [Actinoplanes sp.]
MTVRELGIDFFGRLNRYDPLGASLVGLTAYDTLLPDPRPEADRAAAHRFRAVARSASAFGDDVDAAVLRWMADTAADEAEHCLWEANASAMVYGSPQASYFMAGSDQRLPVAAAFFDALADRYRDASSRGRPSTRALLRQARTQLENHLPRTGPADVRAAMRRLADCYTELLETARDDHHVGISTITGGEAGYRAAVAAHTTLPITPGEVHDLGLELLADLDSQWSALGAETFQIKDPIAVRAHVRDDPALKITGADAIMATVAAALDRAVARTPDITALAASAPCHFAPVPAGDEESAPAAYYRPPAVDGSQPGTVFIRTTGSRFALEALTFHEAVPGHHFQIVAAQGLTGLPDFRRYVDSRLSAYVEGWALYAEQLADELNLYSSPLARLGRVALSALRAARLVADTGLHSRGWSREQARTFLRDNTVLTERDVRQETDRYIAWPGQALAYSVGAREILRLRSTARTALGDRFDLVGFHDQILGAGIVPLSVLSGLMTRWIASAR